MNYWQYRSSVIIAFVCLVLGLAIVVIARSNVLMQQEIQLRQQRLNTSIFTPQAQQIANNVLQDMGSVASTNAPMRALLAKHGYTLQTPQPAPATGPLKPVTEEK
jgi:hypothetical protein